MWESALGWRDEECYDISMVVTRKTEEMNVDEIHYENGRWVELAEDRV
jgi:hypothetical protein